MPIKNIPLGQILLDAKTITPAQLNKALEIQKKNTARKIGDILVSEGFITEKVLVEALGARLKIPYVDLDDIRISPEVTSLLPESIARKYNVIPIESDGKILTIASFDPMNFYAVDDVRIATNLEIKVVLSTGTQIREAIDSYYGRQQVREAADDLTREFNLPDYNDSSLPIDAKIDNAPVVRLVSSIIQQAVSLGASDVHLEPLKSVTRVRMRIDGVLQEMMQIPAGAHSAVVTRLKILGGMDIAERRLPQDGKMEMNLDGRTVDLRFSSLPTISGEKMVIRILGGTGGVLKRSQLGLSPENELLFEKIIKNPHGLILLSGPTGSGKTTTLYSMLNSFNKTGTNIITIEDPVEYQLQGVNQVQINTRAGLTFANGLRSILRQDPDIIMVGEIRDAETAKIAVRAAITGHLVLSTIHTNDAAATVSRLYDMGVEPYLVSSGLVGIIAQRLVRKICPRCKIAYQPDESEWKQVLGKLDGSGETPRFYKGAGCPVCNNTGYRGRTAIHEIISMTKNMRELIDRRASEDELRKQALDNGMMPLKECCKRLVLDGVTTVDEFLKVTYNME